MSDDIKLIKSTEGDWEQLCVNGDVVEEGHKLDARQVIYALMDSGMMVACQFSEAEVDPDYF